jgi:selenophosphate synthetase-related protein
MKRRNRTLNNEIELTKIKELTKTYTGLKRKAPIHDIYSRLVSNQQWGKQLPNFGDDTAVIPNGDGYLLLSADGIMPKLLANEPYAAGKASIMVCVNDIYSMGGKPLAIVNVLGCMDETMRNEIIEGLRKGCDKLRVPMVGGHLHPDSPLPTLSVAALGFAKKLLRSHLAQDGQDIVVAVDLDGKPGCKSVTSWDTNSGKSSEEIIYRLEALTTIAEKELANCCKDISNAGLLGTISIMMENSAKGAVINISKIPVPTGIDFIQWNHCFQGYGFVLGVDPEFTNEVVSIFEDRNVTASVVGKVSNERKVIITDGFLKETLFDFSFEKITGISCQSEYGEKDKGKEKGK